MTPTELLKSAARRERRLRVITPEGGLPGYLVGMDEASLVLYAQYRSGEIIDWTLMTVPRTLVTIVETAELDDEEPGVRETYMQVGGEEFLGQISDRTEEDAQ